MARMLQLVGLLCLLSASPIVHADVRLTVYDDGLSCPGDCDAHVVFHPTMNGTQFAHDSSTTSAPFAKCANGKECRLCVDAQGAQCFVALYRGAGPTKNTFDLTPAFYEQRCSSDSNVPALQAKCKELARAAASLDGRINCIRDPSAAPCKAMMERATAEQAADRTVFDECKRLGERQFNANRAENERRSNHCAYEFKGTGGPNSAGTTWRKLLPGACRSGTFVGRDGLDCCNGEPFTDGPLGLECKRFYPRQ